MIFSHFAIAIHTMAALFAVIHTILVAVERHKESILEIFACAAADFIDYWLNTRIV